MLKAGDTVICIDDSPPHHRDGADFTLIRPVKGERYTVRGVHIEPHIEGYGVHLEECVNPSVVWSDGTEHEWPFDHRRFQQTLLKPASAPAAGFAFIPQVLQPEGKS